MVHWISLWRKHRFYNRYAYRILAMTADDFDRLVGPLRNEGVNLIEQGLCLDSSKSSVVECPGPAGYYYVTIEHEGKLRFFFGCIHHARHVSLYCCN